MYHDEGATTTNDYMPHSDASSITFADDVTSVTRNIDIKADNILEYNEKFTFEIVIPDGSTGLRLDSPAESEVIIRDRKFNMSIWIDCYVHLGRAKQIF